jgi:hypothetical protein
VDPGCRAMSGVIGSLLEAAKVGDDGRTGNDESRILSRGFHAVYTSVRMIEIHRKSASLCHFLDRLARHRGGTARSATRYSITRSDTTRGRRVVQEASGAGAPKVPHQRPLIVHDLR